MNVPKNNLSINISIYRSKVYQLLAFIADIIYFNKLISQDVE